MTFVPFAPGSRVGYRVEPATGCWLWTGATSHGYGRVGIAGTRRIAPAHRVYYEREYGPIPNGVEPDHLCRRRACVNPDHMELVTRQVNARRGAKSKLNAPAVAAMRLDRERGMKLREISAKYGVSNGHISRVLRGVRGYWK